MKFFRCRGCTKNVFTCIDSDALVAGENTSFSSNDEVVGEIRISDDNPCKNNPILV